MVYKSLEDMLQAMEQFKKEHKDIAWEVHDEPRMLRIGFRAITDEGDQTFNTSMVQMRNNPLFAESQQEIIKKYYESCISHRKIEQEYIKLFTERQ